MPSRNERRRELARRMELRLTELRLRWQDVANAGGVSLRAVQSARRGDAEIRLRTQRGIEDGLQWPAGYIQDVLDGKTPTLDAPTGQQPAPASTEPAAEAETEPVPPAVADAIASLIALVTPMIDTEIRRARLRMQKTDVSGREVFANEYEQAVWDLDKMPEYRRVRTIAALRAHRMHDEAEADGGKIPNRSS